MAASPPPSVVVASGHAYLTWAIGVGRRSQNVTAGSWLTNPESRDFAEKRFRLKLCARELLSFRSSRAEWEREQLGGCLGYYFTTVSVSVYIGKLLVVTHAPGVSLLKVVWRLRSRPRKERPISIRQILTSSKAVTCLSS